MRNIGTVCCLTAALCLIPPILGWFDSGQWRWPNFDIRHVFGLGEAVTSHLPVPHDALAPILAANPGWVFLGLGLIFMLIAQRRAE